MKKLILISSAVLSLSACMTMDEDPYHKIKFTNMNEVAGCKLVGNLSASSKNYGIFTATANEERMKNAKKEAYDLGANRIVLGPSEEIGNTTRNEGKAYVCP